MYEMVISIKYRVFLLTVWLLLTSQDGLFWLVVLAWVCYIGGLVISHVNHYKQLRSFYERNMVKEIYEARMEDL